MTALLVAALSLGLPAIDTTDGRADPRAVAALQRLFKSYESVNTLSYNLQKVEVLRSGKVSHEKVFTKYQKPGLVYLKALEPKEGQEVLYRPNVEPNKLVAHKGSFPDLTVNLDIRGSMATKNQRHLISHTGFEYALGVVSASLTRAQKQPAGERIEYGGTRTVGGRKGDLVVLLAGTAKDRTEVARAKESLFAFAKRVGQDPYIIYGANPSIDDFTDRLDEGTGYVVPAYYAHKTELVIDLEHNMLLWQTAADAAGKVFETFEYTNMVVNPQFAPNEFDPDNPAYKF